MHSDVEESEDEETEPVESRRGRRACLNTPKCGVNTVPSYDFDLFFKEKKICSFPSFIFRFK